jgi:methyl-accepting chemotaxis protein
MPSLTKYIAGINEFVAYQNTMVARHAASAESSATTGIVVVVVLGVVSVFVGVGLAVIVGRSVTEPLAALSAAAARLALGETSVSITVGDAKDEVAALAAAMQRLANAEHAVAIAAQQIAAGEHAVEVPVRGPSDVLGASVAQVRTVLSEFGAQQSALVAAAREGRLQVRADASRFRGRFAELVGGLNATVDALIAPVADARAVLDRLAANDLTARMDARFAGDHAALANAINTAAGALDEALLAVRAAAAQVDGAADEIASGSTGLARGASEQAASLEEVAASMHKMGEDARHGAGRSREAVALVSQAHESVDAGAQSIARLSEAVLRIKQSSDETSKIVRTIDEIAFQTNLLALNAAVEAARAGDSGRGFAVVAEEVRALAIRSAAAAKQTESLIAESVRHTGDGVAINAEALTRLGEIRAQIERVGTVMQESAGAADERERDASQITRALESISGITQTVAANAEESSAASQELAGQSRALADLVAGFSLSDSVEARPRAPQRARSRQAA